MLPTIDITELSSVNGGKGRTIPQELIDSLGTTSTSCIQRSVVVNGKLRKTLRCR